MRLTHCVLVVFLALSLSLCAAWGDSRPHPADVVGVYALENPNEPAAVLTLLAEGSGSFRSGNRTAPLTWSKEGDAIMLVFEGRSIRATYHGDALDMPVGTNVLPLQRG